MADHSKIEWTDATWNPITGCSVVSPGCTNCYAMRLAGTRLAHHPSRTGLTRDSKAGPVWTGEVRFNAQWLDQPLRWRKPRMIFVCAHGDLFAEGVEDAWLDQIFAVMALCPQHVFQVLTKRPQRMRNYMKRRSASGHPALLEAIYKTHSQQLKKTPPIEMANWPLPNVWLGVSVEDQKRADERIPVLLDTPAAIRWISAEPLLGPVLIWSATILAAAGEAAMSSGIDWVVAGGESGKGARPMHPVWARFLRDQCGVARVPFLFKQWGEWHPSDQHDPAQCEATPDALHVTGQRELRPTEAFKLIAGTDPDWAGMCKIGKRAAGRRLDGIEHNAFPEVLT